VLFEIRGFNLFTEEEVYRHLGLPKTESVLLEDGFLPPDSVPMQLVEATTYSDLEINVLSGDPLIIDFGEAFLTHIDQDPEKWASHPSFTAPEQLYGQPSSPAADVWAVGCLIFQMHTGRPPLPVYLGRNFEDLRCVGKAFGKWPTEWGDFEDEDE
jgi:serine/threonine protein kinase